MTKSSPPSVSQRMTQVQDPVIPQIGNWIRQNPKTISLAQGVVRYGPPTALLQQLNLQANDMGLHHYGPVQGSVSLRTAIQNKLQSDNGIQVDDIERITVTAGANMAFLHALLAISSPGDDIILLSPFYFNHEMAIRMVGCKPVIVPTNAQHQPVLENIASAITPQTRAIVTVSPNNPSGAVYEQTTLQALNQLCAAQGLYHIHDEAYEYFVYDDVEHYSPGAATDSQAHTLSLFSLSKSYGIAGWRVGYMLAPEHLNLALAKAQDTNLICANRLAQRLATALLAQGQEFCRQQLAYLSANRRACVDALSTVPGCHYTLPGGAFYLLLQLDTDLPALTVCQRLIEDFAVATLPGQSFGLQDGCYLRLSFGALSPEQCQPAMERLVMGLSQIISRPMS